MSEQEPWAYVAMRGTEMQGVIAARMDKKYIRSFYRDFAGTDIKTVFSREEYLALLHPDPGDS